jgi:hypothetical protein
MSAVPRLARAVNAVFFLCTAIYCLLTYSPFAYRQFIKAHLVEGLAEFVVWHHLGFWLVLAITALTMMRERWSNRTRMIGVSYLALSAAAGVVLLIRPVLPQVENNERGLILAFVALVPPAWLAVFDHSATSTAFEPFPTSTSRMGWSALVAAVVVWVQQTAGVPWHLADTGDITLSSSGVVFGVLTSAAAHVLVFSVLFAVAFAVLGTARLVRARPGGEYWVLVMLSAAAVTLVVQRLVFGSIAFSGWAAWTSSVALGVTLALVWSGIARRLYTGWPPGQWSALEIWLAPIPGVRSRLGSFAGLAALTVLSHVVIARVATFDWNFLVQHLSVLVIWFLAFAYSFGAVQQVPAALLRTSLPILLLVAGGLLGGRALVEARLPRWTGEPPFVREFTLDGYDAVDASFRLIHGLRVPSAEDTAFYSHLRASTSIEAPIEPVALDFAALMRPSPERKPHVFLFVVDSMRSDYLSPYNPSVRFTPHIGAFARESDVFERAFTRYGGTGLAVPALWAGGMLIHKMYVTPFDPMNTLLKLLVAERYRMYMSRDLVVSELIPMTSSITELDRGRSEIEFDLCRTLDELQGVLNGAERAMQPVFVYTLPQNIHISHVRSTPVPPGASYPGFEAPVAAAIERIDACFGGFVGFLKQAGLYDDSVIVLTSDHGDSLGESMRWGHSYTMFPEVVRIPLVIRVPSWLRADRTVSPGTLSFLPDVTPTLYSLLGHEPARLGALFGQPLFTPRGPDVSVRRASPYLVASSYGPVYGVLRENGTRLYIADGVNNRDYAYDLTGAAVRVGITAADRAANRSFIREQIRELARIYQFDPRN